MKALSPDKVTVIKGGGETFLAIIKKNDQGD